MSTEKLEQKADIPVSILDSQRNRTCIHNPFPEEMRCEKYGIYPSFRRCEKCKDYRMQEKKK